MESDKLSLQRKMAIKSVKDKVEEQSQKIAHTEMIIGDQMQAIRRQEKMLDECKSLLQKVGGAKTEKKGENEHGTVMRELQSVYDKYLRIYGKKRVSTQKQRDRISDMIDEDGPKKFEQKWLEIGDDADNQIEGEDHYRGSSRYGGYPISKNNNYLTYIQKPYSLFQRRRRYRPMIINNMNANLRSGLMFTRVY